MRCASLGFSYKLQESQLGNVVEIMSDFAQHLINKELYENAEELLQEMLVSNGFTKSNNNDLASGVTQSLSSVLAINRFQRSHLYHLLGTALLGRFVSSRRQCFVELDLYGVPKQSIESEDLLQEAMYAFYLSAQLNDRNINAYLSFAKVLRSQHDVVGAISLYKAALAADTSSAEVHRGLAELYLVRTCQMLCLWFTVARMRTGISHFYSKVQLIHKQATHEIQRPCACILQC